MDTEIDYDKLIDKAFLGVVKDALAFIQKNGIGENYFYITFKTNYDGVKMPMILFNQYPEEMTIVLQHQFSGLEVKENEFSVNLSFGGVYYQLCIPFASLTQFYDPHSSVGFAFGTGCWTSDKNDEEDEPEKNLAPVISIDSFRKK